MKRIRRKKPPKKRNPGYKVLARAVPNEGYRWFECLKNVTFEAVLTDDGKVLFYEVDPTLCGRRQMKEERVAEFFPTDVLRKYRPFLKKGNEDFYACLYRNRKKYRQRFNKLSNEKE